MSRPRPKKSDDIASDRLESLLSEPIDPAIPGTEPVPMPPFGLLMLRDATDEQFAVFADALLRQVAPDDVSGRILAEMVILAACRLRRAARLEPEDELPCTAWVRYQALAERNLRAAAKDLARHLENLAGPASPRPKATATSIDADADADRDPGPEAAPVPESTPEEIADAAANWRSHIALVRSISDEWPILLRLRREAEDVAAWLGDGRTEEELMRWFPGLTRADIAACRACDAEGLCGPFDTADGPYPPGLPVLDDLPDAAGP